MPQCEEEAELQTDTDLSRNARSMDSRDNNSKIQMTSEGRFNCEQCESSFTKKGSLMLHIQSKHEGVKYACNQTHQMIANFRGVH